MTYANMSDLGYYGFDLLKDDAAIENVLKNKPESISEMTDLLFEYARTDETLVYSRAQATEELFNNYSLADIIEEFKDLSHEDLERIHIELIHVCFAERDFTNMLYEEYDSRDYPEDVTGFARVLAIISDVSTENNLGLEGKLAKI